jgi:hypothetical protein
MDSNNMAKCNKVQPFEASYNKHAAEQSSTVMLLQSKCSDNVSA